MVCGDRAGCNPAAVTSGLLGHLRAVMAWPWFLTTACDPAIDAHNDI